MSNKASRAAAPGTTPGTSTWQNRIWLPFLLVGGFMTAAAVTVDSLAADTTLTIAVVGLSAAAASFGVRYHRPHPALGWRLLVAVTSIWFVGWIFWQGYVASHDGQIPALDSWQNIFYLTLYPALVGALIYLLHRADPGRASLIDVLILAAGLGIVVWEVLLIRYVENPEVSNTVKAVQIAFAFADVVLLAALLRVAVARLRPSIPLVLLLLAGLAYLLSNGLWNWAAQLNDYVPGTWGDTGWLLFAVFLGAAALHPSMCTLFDVETRAAPTVGWGKLALLLVAVLVGPTLAILTALSDSGHVKELVVGGGAALVGGLVLVRLGLNLRERQVLASHLEQQNAELKAMDRLKDDFVASVSHELRTPLTSIRGYLELVRDGEAGELTEQQDAFLEVVDRNAERLLRVVGDLLFVAQLDAGATAIERAPADPATLIEHARAAAEPIAEQKGLTLASELGTLPETIEIDASRISQALDNLVSNAVKFTPAGGTVTMRAHATNGHVELAVQDSGPGIAAGDQGRLFERFFRTTAATDQAIAGTGLGLAITKAIVEAHGGTIELESAPGTGSTFRILLPVARA